jgi:uncharacterized phosphosugar-binding protein
VTDQGADGGVASPAAGDARTSAGEAAASRLEATAGVGYLDRVVDHLRQFEDRAGGALDRAAELVLDAVRADRLIHVAGSGHSVAFVLEAFYRAGGLACVNPIWHPALLPLSGGRVSTLEERLSGLGTALIEAARPQAGDLLFVFSQSGINPVPIDLAVAGREAGATVVAITSLVHSRAVASRHSRGRRLADIADLVIDTDVPAGDAIHVAAAGAPAVAPLSSIVGVYAWNAILVRVADRAAVEGVELPVWRSANVPGGDLAATKLIERFAGRIAAL